MLCFDSFRVGVGVMKLFSATAWQADGDTSPRADGRARRFRFCAGAILFSPTRPICMPADIFGGSPMPMRYADSFARDGRQADACRATPTIYGGDEAFGASEIRRRLSDADDLREWPRPRLRLRELTFNGDVLLMLALLARSMTMFPLKRPRRAFFISFSISAAPGHRRYTIGAAFGDGDGRTAIRRSRARRRR